MTPAGVVEKGRGSGFVKVKGAYGFQSDRACASGQVPVKDTVRPQGSQAFSVSSPEVRNRGLRMLETYHHCVCHCGRRSCLRGMHEPWTGVSSI